LNSAFSANQQQDTIVLTSEISSKLIAVFEKLTSAFNETDFIAIEEEVNNLSSLQEEGVFVEEIDKIKEAVLMMDYESAGNIMRSMLH
jgi:serine/threonine-protein kinase RIO1